MADGDDPSRLHHHVRPRGAGQPRRNSSSVLGHVGQELNFGPDRNFITVRIVEVKAATARETEGWFHNITVRRFNAFQNIP